MHQGYCISKVCLPALKLGLYYNRVSFFILIVTDNVYQLVEITHPISNVIIMSKLINCFGQRFSNYILSYCTIIVFTAFT